MTKESGILVAETILSYIESLYSDNTKDWYILSYSNGRENGYYIINYAINSDSRSLAICRGRNSDNIVIYFGTVVSFEPGGNVPNKETYESAKHFPFNAISEAANFVYDYLQKGFVS